MLFLASLVVAIAMESSGFHKRIALRALLLLGDNLRTLFAGFMFTTAFLGVWIINTAATAMILPIADVVIQEVMPTTSPTYRLDNGGDVGQKKKEEEEEDGEVGDHHQFHQEELSSTVVGVTTGFSPEDPRLPPRGNSLVDSRRLSPEEHLELLAQQQLINRSGSNSQNSPELVCKLFSKLVDFFDCLSSFFPFCDPTVKSATRQKVTRRRVARLQYIRRLLYIVIAFAATIGGTTTLTSNGPNLVFQFVLDE